MEVEQDIYWPFGKNKQEESKPFIEKQNISDMMVESWQNEKVRSARLNRQRVTVLVDGDKKEFRSVASAFESLSLPVSRVQRFRQKLKTEGVLDFGFNGKTYCFEVI